MKRLLIFVILGPSIGVFCVMGPSIFLGKAGLSGLWLMLTLAYQFASLPAAIAGLADAFFKKWLAPFFRAIATGTVGVITTGLTIAAITYWTGGNAGTEVSLALVGFVPAALCSSVSAATD